VKRHDALAGLSRDHHHALVVAQRLKRASERTAPEARDKFLEYWREDGQRHFREEEDILLPAYAGFGDPEEPVIARVLVEHVRIRRLAHEVASDNSSLLVLHALGEQLSAHVRREERELFPLIEQTLPEHELTRLVQTLN
jgi:iron-sulfur cluster repair protein YtfE (RIC family)